MVQPNAVSSPRKRSASAQSFEFRAAQRASATSRTSAGDGFNLWHPLRKAQTERLVELENGRLLYARVEIRFEQFSQVSASACGKLRSSLSIAMKRATKSASAVPGSTERMRVVTQPLERRLRGVRASS